MTLSRVSRSLDLAERKKYVALVDAVKEYNGDVKIFSSLHISGERKWADASVYVGEELPKGPSVIR